MAQPTKTKLQHYHSTTAGLEPLAANLVEGELAINVTDRKVYTKNGSGDVVPLSGGATGGGADQIFFENGQLVTADYTVIGTRNAGTFGPIAVDSGVTVTIESGAVWTIV